MRDETTIVTVPLYPPHSIDEPSSDDSAAAGAAAAWNAFAALVACRTRLPWLLALAELSVLQQLLLQAVHVAGALGAERPNKAMPMRSTDSRYATGALRSLEPPWSSDSDEHHPIHRRPSIPSATSILSSTNHLPM